MSFKLKIKELSNNESFNLKLKIKELSCNLSEVSQQRDAAHEKLQEYDSNLVSSIDDELFASLQNDTLISDKPIKTNVMSENVKDLWIKIDGLNTEVKELRASQDSLREQNKALKKENENYVDSSFEKEVVVQKTSSMGISFAGFSLTGPGTQALPKPVVSTNEPNSFESLTFKVKIKELNSKLLNVTKERDEAFLKLKIAQEAEKAFLEADAHIDKSFYSDQIKILEGNIEILSLKLEETSNSNSALSGLVHSLRSENDIMQDQRTQLHEQNIELTAMTLDLRQNVSSMFADMSDLLEKTETCKKELETLKDGSSLYAIDQVKQEYREFQAGVQFRVSGLMSKLEQSEIEKAKLENHINEHLNLVKELREPTGLVPVPIIDPQEFEDCKKLIEMLSDDNEELKDIIFKTKQNLTKVETHLASITVQNTEKIKELTAKNVDLEFKILVFESTDPKNLQKRFAALNQVQGNYKEE
jgi:cell division protein FtsB